MFDSVSGSGAGSVFMFDRCVEVVCAWSVIGCYPRSLIVSFISFISLPIDKGLRAFPNV